MIQIKEYRPSGYDLTKGAVREWHAIFKPEYITESFEYQLNEILKDLKTLQETYPTATILMKRWMLSDIHNQRHCIPEDNLCASSFVGQPPLDGSKACLWVWMAEGGETRKEDNGRYSWHRNGLRHYYETGMCHSGVDTHESTYRMLCDTERFLDSRNCTVLGNCVRTWFFVRDVDINYGGVVKGRNEMFDEHGLTTRTRFIASTGIAGCHADEKVLVQMDSYSVDGLRTGQMRQINDPEYLNSTYEYGVAFERATAIDYADRRHLFISGTASIDNRGNVVAPGDIRRQTHRMLDNIEALLHKGGCGKEDVMQMIVYLRDTADYRAVEKIFAERYPETPRAIVLAPVCRPEWLVETECIAISHIKSDYPSF